ncbi:uncharacterized protein LAESUDRAFT_641902 [Laetiporus sulphureus 93-53]|uniref:Uncharacterized protein n=1 Tax=Laetiporus sulphureus 93-53 TaxID=1314785 RepID=A0A165HTL9_9APHY|nr:uncharacterized protein LAESUDRAFT_641902 [Laetiporus sulphureus 93-53]KZT12173.1 hypothetical protein LAESUDRAFT_641902 [Laetiporus sulphureus 93-53]
MGATSNVASTSRTVEARPSFPAYPSTTPPPPASKSSSANRPSRSVSEPGGLMSVPETPVVIGKRKADQLETTPPDTRAVQHPSFIIPARGVRRSYRSSETSNAASSYQHKRVRLSSTTPAASPAHSRPSSSAHGAISADNASPSRLGGRTLVQLGSALPSTQSTTRTASFTGRRESWRRISQGSIPISAIVRPRPPSVATSGAYSMYDPRKPRIKRTGWAPHLGGDFEDASPLHAWCFFVGFIVFPIWWIASFLPIPKTREVGGTDTEKAVPLDDPQVEHDAIIWRKRCRIMSGIAFLTYIPFIVLVAVLVPLHI